MVEVQLAVDVTLVTVYVELTVGDTTSDVPYAIAVDSAKNVYLGGGSNISGIFQWQIAKYNLSGALQWQKSIYKCNKRSNL